MHKVKQFEIPNYFTFFSLKVIAITYLNLILCYIKFMFLWMLHLSPLSTFQVLHSKIPRECVKTWIVPNHVYNTFFVSVQFSRSVVSDSLRPRESQHTRPPCPSPTPGVHPNSCRWWHPAISSSVVPFFSCPLSLPASGSVPVSQLSAWGGQSIGVSASASVLPMNIQDWSPLGWAGWISLHSKGLARIFSSTTVQKHQFFSAQLSSQSNSHIHTWSLEKP